MHRELIKIFSDTLFNTESPIPDMAIKGYDPMYTVILTIGDGLPSRHDFYNIHGFAKSLAEDFANTFNALNNQKEYSGHIDAKLLRTDILPDEYNNIKAIKHTYR